MNNSKFIIDNSKLLSKLPRIYNGQFRQKLSERRRNVVGMSKEGRGNVMGTS